MALHVTITSPMADENLKNEEYTRSCLDETRYNSSKRNFEILKISVVTHQASTTTPLQTLITWNGMLVRHRITNSSPLHLLTPFGVQTVYKSFPKYYFSLSARGRSLQDRVCSDGYRDRVTRRDAYTGCCALQVTIFLLLESNRL